MRKIYFLSLFIVLQSSLLFAQNMHFKESITGLNNNYGGPVIPAMNGGYFFYGNTSASLFGKKSFFILHTNANGQVVWWKSFSSPRYSQTIGALVQNDSGSLLAAFTFYDTISGSNSHTAILKLDSDGNIVSQHAYDLYNGAAAQSGPVKLIKGRFANEYLMLVYISVVTDISAVAKVNSSGAITAAYGVDNGTYLAYSADMQQTADSGFIFTSYSNNFWPKYAWLAKINSTGGLQWAIRVSNAVDSVWTEPTAIYELAGGGYLWEMYYYDVNSTPQVLVKVSPTGNIISYKQFKAVSPDTINYGGSELCKINEQSFALLGRKRVTGTTHFKSVVSIIDTSGNFQSGKLFDFGNNDAFGYINAKSSSEMIFSGGHNTSDILFGLTNFNSSNECYESSYSLVKDTVSWVRYTVSCTTPVITVAAIAIDTLNSITISGSDSIICSALAGVNTTPAITGAITIFPNPSAGSFTINFTDVIKKGTIQIYNLLGEKIFDEEVMNKSKMEINLKNISKGVYFLKLNDGANQYSRELIIN